MFEKAISFANIPAGVPGGLRPLDWAELVARFDASRDVRAAMRTVVGVPASFASAMDGLGRKRPVNRDDLARGKGEHVNKQQANTSNAVETTREA